MLVLGMIGIFQRQMAVVDNQNFRSHSRRHINEFFVTPHIGFVEIGIQGCKIHIVHGGMDGCPQTGFPEQLPVIGNILPRKISRIKEWNFPPKFHKS